MIVMPGRNPLGNVLHVVVGPESDLFLDVHGAAIVDITDLIKIFNDNPGEKVFVCFTRTLNEVKTMVNMSAMKMMHKNSFGVSDQITLNNEPVPESKDTCKSGKCSGCGKDNISLPIPGFTLCESCTKIELGLKAKKAKATDVNAGKPK